MNKKQKNNNNLLFEIKEGAEYSWNTEEIRYASIIFFVMNFGLKIFYGNLIYFLTVIHSVDEKNLGILFSVIGIGSLIGSILSPMIIKNFKTGRIITISSLAMGVLTLLILANPTPTFTIIIQSIISIDII